MEMEQFLKQCEASGDAAYGAFRTLLTRLEDPATRPAARVFLSDLVRHVGATSDALSKYHFSFQDIHLEKNDAVSSRKLTMMVIPSIFIPEDWSFTFYEGLNRHPNAVFRDKTVTELGCGNGWITIAIAHKWLPKKIYGLDINPRAIRVSWINLYLNALDDQGEYIYDSEKKTLLDRVEFHESDLLGYIRTNCLTLDRIVGCIPQILNPNPEAMTRLISENASEEFLHDLSNYCALQGFVEDQFGLGLIARAVEEAISVITPTGLLVFNMGGRPGQGVCKRLFERRGFNVTHIWQTKVVQAADTDITALVEIEKNSPHRFEFFMGLTGDHPVCARTAWAYGRAGGRIAHALSVYSCQLRQPNNVKAIFEFLKNGYHEASSSLDLSFQNDSVSDEKIPFLAYLAHELASNPSVPFVPPSGNVMFRGMIAGFFKAYHRVPISVRNVIVFPSRAVSIENILRLYSPSLAIVDESLTRFLPRKWLTSLPADSRNGDVVVVDAPRQSDLMVELVRKLKPRVVITGTASFEAVTTSAFVQLVETTKQNGARLFLDISEQFELSSVPPSFGVLKFLAGKRLPSHVGIICGLVKNQVYSDLEVAFAISEEEDVCAALSKTVEILEGSTAPIRQYYYGCLFHELLSFQLADRQCLLERESEGEKSKEIIEVTESTMKVFDSSELSINEESAIHMDVDECFLPSPVRVKAAIFESFARQNLSDSETDVAPLMKKFVENAIGLQVNPNAEFIYSDSSLSLFNRLVLCCNEEHGTICFPSGANGSYLASCKFLKANILTIPTTPENDFKLTSDGIYKAIHSVEKPWVYISGPTVSPTGALYSMEEIEGLLDTCKKCDARVIIDTSFSGLEFDREWKMWNSIDADTYCVSMLGGMSLRILSGALKFGFLMMNQPELVERFNQFPGLSKPHSTVRYALRKLLGMHDTQAELGGMIGCETEKLKCRYDRLKETLEKCGWDVMKWRGGVSVLAKPTAYDGKTVGVGGSTVRVDDSSIRELMLKTSGLCINSGQWTGIPGYCRFNIGLDDGDFGRALECLVSFKNLVLGH